MPLPSRSANFRAGRACVANGAYGVFAALVVLLAFLPTGISATRQTVSAYALSPQSVLLRVAFACLAVGSGFAAYEFRRSIPGVWGRVIAGLTAVWVTGAAIDTGVNVDASGVHTLHGTVHAVVAVVSFGAVAGTIIAFLGWLRGRRVYRRRLALAASLLALLTVAVELAVTATSATFMAGTAERAFFLGALTWMIVARYTVARHPVARSVPPAPRPASTPRTRPAARVR